MTSTHNLTREELFSLLPGDKVSVEYQEGSHWIERIGTVHSTTSRFLAIDMGTSRVLFYVKSGNRVGGVFKKAESFVDMRIVAKLSGRAYCKRPLMD